MNNSYKKASSDYAFNYTEYLVKRENDKKILLARAGIIAFALLLFAFTLFLMFGPIKIPQVAVIAVVLIIYIAMMMWGFTSIEYEYLIVSGVMSMDKITGGKRRRQMVEFKVASAESVLPLKNAKLDGIDTIYAVSSVDAEDAYSVIFKDDSGEKRALVFNATDKALEMIKYYNRGCFTK